MPADELDLAAGRDDRLHELGVVPFRLVDRDRDRVAADRHVRAARVAAAAATTASVTTASWTAVACATPCC